MITALIVLGLAFLLAILFVNIYWYFVIKFGQALLGLLGLLALIGFFFIILWLTKQKSIKNK